MPNIVPAITEMKFWLRAPTHTDLIFLQQKCAACFVAAAKVISNSRLVNRCHNLEFSPRQLVVNPNLILKTTFTIQ